jgi:hypothetical protein
MDRQLYASFKLAPVIRFLVLHCVLAQIKDIVHDTGAHYMYIRNFS